MSSDLQPKRFGLAAAALVSVLAVVACGPAREEAGGTGTIAADAAPGGATANAGVALSAAQRQGLVGNYSITTPDGQRVTFRVWEENGELMAQTSGQPPTRLAHEGNNVFRTVTGTPYSLAFMLEAGRANRVTVRSQTQTMEAVRIP